MSYLTLDEIQALLAQPDTKTAVGRRDLAMLALLYDTGARVQELAGIKHGDVRLSSPVVIRLMGKGGKSRLVPIMAPTENLLRTYLEEHKQHFLSQDGLPLFQNRAGKKLTHADEHFKCKALTLAYPSPTPEPEMPLWHKDADLSDWLKALGT